MGIANPQTTIDTHTKRKKQPKHNTKDDHQTTREENTVKVGNNPHTIRCKI